MVDWGLLQISEESITTFKVFLDTALIHWRFPPSISYKWHFEFRLKLCLRGLNWNFRQKSCKLFTSLRKFVKNSLTAWQNIKTQDFQVGLFHVLDVPAFILYAFNDLPRDMTETHITNEFTFSSIYIVVYGKQMLKYLSLTFTIV